MKGAAVGVERLQTDCGQEAAMLRMASAIQQAELEAPADNQAAELLVVMGQAVVRKASCHPTKRQGLCKVVFQEVDA